MTTPAGPLVRVLLVDDQELVRSGLTRILRRRDGFIVVGECEDGDQVLAAVEELRPDVVVMDLRMRRMSGIEATVELRRRADTPPVLVLTTFDDDELLSGALRAGAAGFLLKDSPAEDVVRGVAAVAAGHALLDPAVTGRVLDRFRATPDAVPAARPESIEELTAREREVLELMGRGLSNGEIASTLVISEVTVKSHIGRIFTKLDLRDRAAAIVYAFDRGLVAPEAEAVALEHTVRLHVADVVGDPRALGAAVTTRLCGHWEHDGPCRWPHHIDWVADEGGAELTVRYDAAPGQVVAVVDEIVAGLAGGALTGPDGSSTTWGTVRVD